MIEYFKQYGIVADAIVMRDRNTNRGRGFGFVKMQFENRDKAQENKIKLLRINVEGKGHIINDKRVDVKSADDYVKPPGGPIAPSSNISQNQGGNLQQALKTFQNLNQGSSNNQNSTQDSFAGVSKPNPYVIVDTDKAGQNEGKKEIVFKYPKSKIFVGGLDFRLTNEELK